MTDTQESRIEELQNEDTPLSKAISILLDKKAQNVVIYDLKTLSQLFDYVVIATGLSSTQIGVIKGSLERELREIGSRPLGAEGDADSGWILIDYNDFIIHVFDVSKRNYYRLDKLWADQPSVVIASEDDLKD